MRKWFNVMLRPLATSLIAFVLAAPLAAQEAAENGIVPFSENAIDTAPDDMGEVAPLVSTGEAIVGDPTDEGNPTVASDGNPRNVCEEEAALAKESAIDTAPDDMGEEAPLVSTGKAVVDERVSDGDPTAASEGYRRSVCKDETAPVNESAIDTAPDDMGEGAPQVSSGETTVQSRGEVGSDPRQQPDTMPKNVDPE